jgi:hypothetical protein
MLSEWPDGLPFDPLAVATALVGIVAAVVLATAL